MRGHTKKHHTETKPSPGKKEASLEWGDDTFKEWFGKESKPAIMLRGLRHREGLTQVQLGDMLGIAQTNISLMEKGKRTIGKQVAKRLAELFQIDYRSFL